MNEKTYNGWTNYETWNVKLWMDNDEGSQGYWTEQAEEAYNSSESDSCFNKEDRAALTALTLAESIKDEYENALQDILENAKIQASVWADLFGAALSEVNWHEIASSLVSEVEKETVAD
jgi:hypothetical protein